jgi:hypothetical protein
VIGSSFLHLSDGEISERIFKEGIKKYHFLNKNSFVFGIAFFYFGGSVPFMI